MRSRLRAVVCLPLVALIVASTGCTSDGDTSVDSTAPPTTAAPAPSTEPPATTEPQDGGDPGITEGGPAECPLAADVEFMCQLRYAANLVDAELGGPQQYFEITANDRGVSVFVAIDGATSAVPYLVIDDRVEVLGDPLTGASGQTFAATAIEYDPAAMLASFTAELPTTRPMALSVEGGPGGSVRFVLAAISSGGEPLSIALESDGTIISLVE